MAFKSFISDKELSSRICAEKNMHDGEKLNTVREIYIYLDLEDSELVKKSANGDERAFEELRRRHQKSVHAICFRMTRNTDSAEELAQEVFIKVWQKLDMFRGESSFSTWLYKLTVTHILDYYRKNKRRLECEQPDNHPKGDDLGRNDWLDKADSRLNRLTRSPRINLLRGTPEYLLENTENIRFFRFFTEHQEDLDKRILEYRIFEELKPLEIAVIIDDCPAWEHLSDAEKAKRISNRIGILLKRFAEILEEIPYYLKEENLRKF